MADISPKAAVLNPAGLADDVRIGPFSFLGPEVAVGAGTVIHNNVTITGRARIGAGCQLFPGCIIGCPPGGSGSAEAPAGLCMIGEGNTIREQVVIEAGAAEGPAASAPAGEQSGTILGAKNLLMVGCQVGHDATLEGEGIFDNCTRIEHHARIERFVRMGAFTNITPYATVGAYTFTTGYACVDRDAPPYAIVHGSPFRVRNVNSENLRRCGFDAETIEALKKAFRMLFDGQAGFPDTDRLRSVEQALDNRHVKYLVDSIRRSSLSPAGRCLQGRT